MTDKEILDGLLEELYELYGMCKNRAHNAFREDSVKVAYTKEAHAILRTIYWVQEKEDKVPKETKGCQDEK